MEIKIETTTKKTKKVKIELPFYCKDKNGYNFYKVYSEKECIEVGYYLSSSAYSIQTTFTSIALDDGFKNITEKQFVSKFNEVTEKLRKIAI